jgi:protein-glutamine gamma-glutamyltransferase
MNKPLSDQARKKLILISFITIIGNLTQVPFEQMLMFIPLPILMFRMGWNGPVSKFLLFSFAISVPVYSMLLFDGQFETGAKNLLLLGMLAAKATELKTWRDGKIFSTIGIICPFVAVLFDLSPATTTISFIGMLAGFAMNHVVAMEAAGQKLPSFKNTAIVTAICFAWSLPIALFAYQVLPRLNQPAWGYNQYKKLETKTGVNDKMEPGAWTELFNNYETAFIVYGMTPQINVKEPYWRGPVLESFDGRAWRRNQSRFLEQNPTVDYFEEKNVQNITYRVLQEPTKYRYTFALDTPLMAAKTVRMGGDFALFTGRYLPVPTQFNWEGLHGEGVIPVKLTMEEKKLLTEVPVGNEKSKQLVLKWKSENDNPAYIAEQALNYFKENLTYSLIAPALGEHVVDDFLFVTKQGFCEHFSSSFSLLMRMAGIPSRIVNGYLGGEYDPYSNIWHIRQADAHAWSEIWIDGKGWIRVEPTSGLRTSNPVQQSESGANKYIWNWIKAKWYDTIDSLNSETKRAATISSWQSFISKTLFYLLLILFALAIIAISLINLNKYWNNRDIIPEVKAWKKFEKKLQKIINFKRENHQSIEVYLDIIPDENKWNKTKNIINNYLYLRFNNEKSNEVISQMNKWRGPEINK